MDDPCLTLEGAYLSRQGIEVVEAAVVRVGRYGTNTAHRIQLIGGRTPCVVKISLELPPAAMQRGGFFCRTDPTDLTDFCAIVLAVWERMLNFDLRSKVGCISEIKTKKPFFILYFARFALPLHTKACETAHAACRQKCTNDNDYGISNIHS